MVYNLVMNEGLDIKKIKPTKESSQRSFFPVLILAFSILLPVLLIEIFLSKSDYPFQDCNEIFTSAESYLGEFDELTGWSYKPKISYYESNQKFAYHFNDEGIRVASPASRINYEKPRLVFIGDSVTFGEELNYEDSFVFQVGKLLKDKFEVVNLGVQGFGTDQSLLRLEKFIDELDPDYVVYTFIVDHKNRNINYDRRLHVKCFEFSGTKPLFDISKNELKQVGYPKKPILTDRFKVNLFLSHSWQNFREQIQRNYGGDTELTQGLVTKIGETVKNSGAADYYIYFDTIYDPNEDGYHHQVAKSIFSEDQLSRTLMFINWAEDSNKKGTKYYVNENDDLHPNASLSALMAKSFVEKFGGTFGFEEN